MNKLDAPDISYRDSYSTCVTGVADGSLKDRFEACKICIDDHENEYYVNVKTKSLFTITPLVHKRGADPIVMGNVHKSELKKLYDYYMVKKQPARNIYDTILVSANGKCPFCGGIGYPKTLDHYLPKAKYPQFSVLPINLIPSCRDCNSGKGTTLATSVDSQVLHPYFDDDCFYNEQWVFANVIQTVPCVVEFYVASPSEWSQTQKNRAETHFGEFELGNRYSIQAATELSTLIDQRNSYMENWSSDAFSEYLQSYANSTSLFTNHWKRVMYQSLAEDDWFCGTQL